MSRRLPRTRDPSLLVGPLGPVGPRDSRAAESRFSRLSRSEAGIGTWIASRSAAAAPASLRARSPSPVMAATRAQTSIDSTSPCRSPSALDGNRLSEIAGGCRRDPPAPRRRAQLAKRERDPPPVPQLPLDRERLRPEGDRVLHVARLEATPPSPFRVAASIRAIPKGAVEREALRRRGAPPRPVLHAPRRPPPDCGARARSRADRRSPGGSRRTPRRARWPGPARPGRSRCCRAQRAPRQSAPCPRAPARSRGSRSASACAAA